MPVVEALNTLFQVVVIALVIAILQKIGTVSLSVGGFDFAAIIPLVLGVCLVYAAIEALAGIYTQVRAFAK